MTRSFLALDVGTRTVVALACRTLDEAGDEVEVFGLERIEHAGRPMRDGAVEDVEAVAAAVREAVGRLGVEAPATAAVAGRTLAARRGRAHRRFDPPREILPGDEAAMAAAAAAEAAASAAAPPHAGGLAHVGTVVVSRRADGAEVGRLAGRVAAAAEVEVVATFLPAAAVEAKARALSAAGIVLEGLLLEPIAVLGALVPTGTAAGDVALVDVGAGTTDVAVVRPGGAADFRAIGIAGDEATDAVGGALFVDFMAAERAKRAAAEGLPSEVLDALGRRREIDPGSLTAVLEEESDRLAAAAAAQIRSASGHVRAVVCVGGGSLLPGFPARLAAALGLPPEAAVIRGAETVAGVVDRTGRLEGPHLTTAAAIARTASRALRPSVWEVERPGAATAAAAAGTGAPAGDARRRVFALSAPDGRTAAELLLAAGCPADAWEGDPGRSLAVVVRTGPRESVEVFPGTPGATPRVEVDGAVVGLEALVPPGKTLRLRRGADGADAAATVADALRAVASPPPSPLPLILNGRQESTADGRPARRNGRPVALEAPLVDGDVVEAAAPRLQRSLAEVVASAAARHRPGARLRVLLEGTEAPLDAPAGSGSVVEIRWT